MVATNTDTSAPAQVANHHIQGAHNALSEAAIRSLLGCLRLNLTQPECSDGGLRG